MKLGRFDIPDLKSYPYNELFITSYRQGIDDCINLFYDMGCINEADTLVYFRDGNIAQEYIDRIKNKLPRTLDIQE